MENPKLILAALAALLLLNPGEAAEAQTRNESVDLNLIIDGSRYTRDLGGEIAEWLCGYVIDGMLQEGDYLRIRVAAEKAETLYSGVFNSGDEESVKALLRAPLPGSEGADFAGALGDLFSPAGERRPLMSYTLFVSSPRGISPAHLGTASSYLRFSRVIDFPGWRALVIAPGIGPRVREAADAFLAGG
jgi:hypothetical protein